MRHFDYLKIDFQFRKSYPKSQCWLILILILVAWLFLFPHFIYLFVAICLNIYIHYIYMEHNNRLFLFYIWQQG